MLRLSPFLLRGDFSDRLFLNGFQQQYRNARQSAAHEGQLRYCRQRHTYRRQEKNQALFHRRLLQGRAYGKSYGLSDADKGKRFFNS